MINWKGCGTKRSCGPFYAILALVYIDWTKSQKPLKIAGVPFGIWSRPLLNASRKHFRLSQCATHELVMCIIRPLAALQMWSFVLQWLQLLPLPPTPRRSTNLKTVINFVAGVIRSGDNELLRVERLKNVVKIPACPGNKNGCVGEHQQQFCRPDPYLK
jgi:hypothetical protein